MWERALIYAGYAEIYTNGIWGPLIEQINQHKATYVCHAKMALPIEFWVRTKPNALCFLFFDSLSSMSL